MVAGVGLVLAGCFTTAADFQRDAEAYIASTVAEALSTEFAEVTCEQPRSQEVDTRFVCTAVDTSGGVWEFDNRIDTPESFIVDLRRRPAP